MSTEVEDIIFNAQDHLASVWKDKYPKGKLPDRIRYLLMEVLREYNILKHKADKGE